MRLYQFFLLSAIICVPMLAVGQSPYEISWKKEKYFVGAGGLILFSALTLNRATDPFTITQIQALDPDGIIGFDRSAIGNYSQSARKLSDYAAFGSIALPFGLLLHKTCRSDIAEISLLWLETNLINQAVTDLTKYLVRRPRPFAYNPEVPLESKLELNARLSFISGHASVSATNSFLFAKIFSDYFPSSNYKELVWFVAASIPAVSAYSRVKAGKHFPSDVITGYVLGASIGLLIPSLHKRTENSNIDLSLINNGFRLQLNF